MRKSKELSSSELKEIVDTLLEQIKGIPEDPKTLKAAEELHRELSYLSLEDLLTTFTI